MHRFLTTACLVIAALAPASAERVTIASLAELAGFAGRSGNVVTLQPGTYRMVDWLPPDSMGERRKRKEFAFVTFAGNDNTFVLDGVTIEFDTALRAALNPPVHTNEFVISGNGNTLQGLTLTCIGDGTSPGGALVAVRGKGNTLRDCTFYVRGSSPYGYGDLFGKGGPGVLSHRKHSGVLVTGDRTHLAGCRLVMRAFGHGYFIQKDAADVLIEDCTVEGEMRPTDAMLAETSGRAFGVDFRTVIANRAGENRVTPGYMKSLAEDGFRTYGQHDNLVIRNCTATNMRAGFELRSKTSVRLENCTALGCERGFWISSGAEVSGCRGDAQFGPLLFLEGDKATVDLTLLPTTSDRTVHALATVRGSGHAVEITPAEGSGRPRPLPILLGFGAPPAGEGMAPYSEKTTRDVTLTNRTAMPVAIGAMAARSIIESAGAVTENLGTEISIVP